MQQALKQTFKQVKKQKRKPKKAVKPKAKLSVFSLIMVLAMVCFSIALARVVQFAVYNQYALENEQLKQNISESKQISDELTGRKLSLGSPQRIETFAKSKLKMIKPKSVRYIVFRKKQNEVKVALKR